MVVTNHFPCHAMEYMTPNQMAKTVVKVLYEKYISIFGAPTKILSNRASFASALVTELCALFSIEKLCTMLYHVQCNGQVKRFHQTLFRMIRKLDKGKKDNWVDHLAEVIQAYNGTYSAITGYSPHLHYRV